MKKLNKLQINSEKLMKSEELMTLRGGYGGTGSCCVCLNGSNTFMSYRAAASQTACQNACVSASSLWHGSFGPWSICTQ